MSFTCFMFAVTNQINYKTMELYRAKCNVYINPHLQLIKNGVYTLARIPYTDVHFSDVLAEHPTEFIKIERTFMVSNGAKEHGKYIIEKLESFGGLNDKGFDGRGTTNSIYYIDEDGNIRATDTAPKDLKITSSEVQAEKTFPRLMEVFDEDSNSCGVQKVIAYLPGRGNGLPFITDHASFAFAEEPTPEALEIKKLIERANELWEKAEKLKSKKGN